MEYCDIGDIEDYIKTIPNQRFNTEDTLIIMFQMTVSLYKAKTIVLLFIQCNLRHYDIKLLNFFGKTYQPQNNFSGVHWIYNYNNIQYQWKRKNNIIIKLADYGTAQMDNNTLNSTIDVGNVYIYSYQYTTIENLPIEYFIDSNNCKQDYTCDIWQLGLSFLHLLTGKAPYYSNINQV